MKRTITSFVYPSPRCYLLLSASILSWSGTALAQESAGATAPQAAQSSSATVGEIIVTAQKREQSLQDVPISITAISPDAIVANRIQDVRDLSGLAPNLTVRPSAGGNVAPNYSMRGIFTNATAVGVDKGIALYLDGVYIQASAGSIFELADIKRIEVLKGPQGTLFGRNATAGAISIVTRDPSGVFSARQDFTYGNYGQLRSKTQVDLPKFGPFSASLSYLHSERKGDVRNLGAGTVWDYGPATQGRFGKRTSPKRFGDQNVEAFFGALKADLHPDLDVIYKFDYSQNNYTPDAVGLAFLDPTSPLAGLYAGIPNPTPISKKRPSSVNNWFTTPSYVKVQGHNLTAQLRLNDEISIKNILAYRKTYQQSTFQLDGLGGAFIAPGLAFALTTSNAETIERQWSNELQVNVTTDWFNLTAGYIHFDDKIATGGFEGAYNLSSGITGSGIFFQQPDGSFLVPSNPGYEHSRVKAVSDAWYLQPEIRITDQVEVVLGARITRDKKNGVEFTPVPSAVPPGLATTPIEYRVSKPSFLAGLNFKPTPEFLAYVKFATGYVSGGQLGTIPFDPETAKSYEGGIKADLFGRRLRSNLAVYHVDYKNIQQATSGPVSGIPTALLYSQVVVPSGDGRAYGFEWENTFIPVDHLTLTGNLGYTNFKYDKDTIFPGFQYLSGLPGFQNFSRPKWTAQLSAQYETEPVVAGGRFVGRIDANFRSRTLLSPDLTSSDGFDQPETPGLRDAATAPAYWLINGRLSLADVSLGGVKAEIAAWGRNLLNERPIVQYVTFGPIGPVIYERARTYGVDLSFSF